MVVIDRGRGAWSASLVALLAVAALGAVRADAAALPDLGIRAVSTSSASAPRSEEIRITDTTKNNGKGRARSSQTRYYLSVDSKRNAGDLRLPGSRAVGPLAGGRSSRGSAKLAIPADAPLGDQHVVACADDKRRVRESNERNNCRASGVVDITEALTTYQRLDAAVQRGEISNEDALKYKVFSDFGDPRLPAEFAGVDAPAPDSPALDQVEAEWATLSAATRGALEPFFLPPFYTGSWTQPLDEALFPRARAGATPPAPPGSTLCSSAYSQNVQINLDDWAFEDSANGKVKVWWEVAHPEDEARAEAIAAAVDAEIWTDIDSVFREPLADGGPVSRCQGPDARVDIALTPLATALGKAYRFGFDGANSGFALIDRDADADLLLPTVAHELTHVSHFAYVPFSKPRGASRLDYAWLTEATATWAEHLVYPGGDSEHLEVGGLLDRPELALDTYESDGNDKHQYGAYLWFLYLGHELGTATVADVWDQFEDMDSLRAIRAAVLGTQITDLDEAWAEFALFNLNREPVDRYAWDRLDHPAAIPKENRVDLATDTTQLLPVDLPHLSAKYFDLRFDDPDIQQIEIKNVLAGDQSASVQALIRLGDGTWQDVEDWSDTERHTFCRANPGEDVRQIYLIVANTGIDKSIKVQGHPEVSAKSGCPYVGSASGVQMRDGLTIPWSATFELEPRFPDPVVGGDVQYRVADGTFRIAASGTMTSGCTLSVPETTYALPEDFLVQSDGGFHLDFYTGTDQYEFDVRFAPAQPKQTGTFTCFGSSSPAAASITGSWDPGKQAGAPGQDLSGSGSGCPSDPSYSCEWSWDLSTGAGAP